MGDASARHSTRIPSRRPRAVLFDLDGTLVDSLPDLAASANELLTALGRPAVDQVVVSGWIGQGVERLVERCLGGAPTPSELTAALERFRAIYLHCCCDRTTALPGARETLQAVRGLGIRTGVVTNKPIAPSRRILQALQLETLLEVTIGGDSGAGHKPARGPIDAAAAALGVPVDMHHLWLVGDSWTDLETAAAAEIVGVGVLGGYDQGQSLDRAPHPAWKIVRRLSDVVELLASLPRA